MNDETLVDEDHIIINNSWSRGTEDVNDIRPKNQGQGDNLSFLVLDNVTTDDFIVLVVSKVKVTILFLVTS